jgi:hypothetical protein
VIRCRVVVGQTLRSSLTASDTWTGRASKGDATNEHERVAGYFRISQARDDIRAPEELRGPSSGIGNKDKIAGKRPAELRA